MPRYLCMRIACLVFDHVVKGFHVFNALNNINILFSPVFGMMIEDLISAFPHFNLTVDSFLTSVERQQKKTGAFKPMFINVH